MPHFTRADVEAFFNKHYGADAYPKCELESIHVLPELNPPTWLVTYQATYSATHVRYYKLIVTQFTNTVTGQHYLNLVTEVDA